jgi:hypothetical protein
MSAERINTHVQGLPKHVASCGNTKTTVQRLVPKALSKHLQKEENDFSWASIITQATNK